MLIFICEVINIREVKVASITQAVDEACREAVVHLPGDVMKKIVKAHTDEQSPVSKSALQQILDNHDIAVAEEIPMCQDTGIVVVFAKVGREVHLDGDIYKAINDGVERAYVDGNLRKSVVGHPLDRKNTKTNTPAIIHIELVEGDKVTLDVAPKGGGSENMSALKMLKPSDGIEGVKEFVIHTIFHAGGNPCPPIIVGVGIGGNFEQSAILAKKALMRKVDDSSTIEVNKKLEDELYEEINKLGIGTLGFGGTETALGVKVETQGCHIASLPVAINLQCHAARHIRKVV